MAEADRDTYRREQAALAREKEIMKDVPDWEVRIAAGSLRSGTPCSKYTDPNLSPLSVFSFRRRFAGWQERVQHQALHPSIIRCHLM